MLKFKISKFVNCLKSQYIIRLNLEQLIQTISPSFLKMNESRKVRKIRQTWQNARKHKKASRLGLPANLLRYELCDCCDQAIQKQPISLWQHTKQFQIYGFGYPLWFSFLKYCIALVLILIATRSADEIYMATNNNRQFCYENSINSHQNTQLRHFKQQNTQSDLRNFVNLRRSKQKSTGGNYQSGDLKQNENQKYKHTNHRTCTSILVYLSIFQGQKMYQSNFLQIIQFLVHLTALITIRSMILKELQYYHQRRAMISDYSLIVSGLPQVYGTRSMLLEMFQLQFGKYWGFNIKEMIFIFNQQKLVQIKKRIQDIKNKIITKMDEQDYQQVVKLEEQLTQVQKKLQTQAKEINGNINQDYIKCNKIIIIMNTQGDKASVLHEYQENKKKLNNYKEYFNKNNMLDVAQIDIQIRQAPQPNEIIWQNLDIPDKNRKKLKLQGWGLTFLFLALITVLFYLILQSKTKLYIYSLEMQQSSKDNQIIMKYKIFGMVIVSLAIFIVILFNKFLMGKVLHYFVHMEKHAYTDAQNYSFALKYALGMFFTTALMTLAVEAITFKNFYTHSLGVIQQETIMFFVTAFIIPLIWLIHPFQLFKRYNLKNNVNELISQEKANQLVEDQPYDLGKRYAQLFEIMWFTFLYSQLIPLGPFLIFVGLILYFWVDKFNFIRRSSLKAGMSGKMAILGLKSLDATLFLTNAGEILFDVTLRGQFDILPVILMIIGIVYLFIPISQLIWYFNHQKFHLEQKQYDQNKQTFKESYFTQHPVYSQTHKAQIQQHRKKVNEYHKNELKKIKLFGVGRGYYIKNIQTQRFHMYSEMRISSKYII